MRDASILRRIIIEFDVGGVCGCGCGCGCGEEEKKKKREARRDVYTRILSAPRPIHSRIQTANAPTSYPSSTLQW